jgi:hypothetical protein
MPQLHQGLVAARGHPPPRGSCREGRIRALTLPPTRGTYAPHGTEVYAAADVQPRRIIVARWGRRGSGAAAPCAMFLGPFFTELHSLLGRYPH